MYNIHSVLFDYSEFLHSTNISAIEMSDKGVIMKFRDSGIKFICSKNDKRLAPFDTLNFGDYEQEELELQLKLIESNTTVIDIGGNFGWYAMSIAKNKPSTKVLTFEPIPSTYNHLVENIRINKFTNINTFNFGFSDDEGDFTFYIDPTLSVNASLANVSEVSNINSVKCHVRKLDDFVVQNNEKIGFIKCDVEGAEFLVFKGGVNMIKDQKPIVFTEMLRKWTAKFNYHPNDIIMFFKELGYSCFTAKNGKLLKFDVVDENTVDTNYFFLHNDKHLNQIENLLY
jgi:FkbM family methyltransferase